MNTQLQSIFSGYDSRGQLNLNEYHCGPGSSIWYTELLRKELVPFLNKYGIKSMLDAPCGDFQWLNLVEFPNGFEYIGGDLHHDMIRRNNILYNREFIVLDITEDDLPTKDLMFVRDCLFHFPDTQYKKRSKIQGMGPSLEAFVR